MAARRPPAPQRVVALVENGRGKAMKRLVLTLALMSVASGLSGYAQDKQGKPKIDVSFVEKRLAVVPPDAELGRRSIVFSPDGKTVSYILAKGGKSFVVVGDKKGEEFDSIEFGPQLSADGKTVAYLAFR